MAESPSQSSFLSAFRLQRVANGVLSVECLAAGIYVGIERGFLYGLGAFGLGVVIGTAWVLLGTVVFGFWSRVVFGSVLQGKSQAERTAITSDFTFALPAWLFAVLQFVVPVYLTLMFFLPDFISRFQAVFHGLIGR